MTKQNEEWSDTLDFPAILEASPYDDILRCREKPAHLHTGETNDRLTHPVPDLSNLATLLRLERLCESSPNEKPFRIFRQPLFRGPQRVRVYHQTHTQLKEHMQTFLMACNFSRRLKSLKVVTPYEDICNKPT